MTQLEKVIYCIAEAARNVGHDRRDAFHIAIDPHDGLHSRQSENFFVLEARTNKNEAVDGNLQTLGDR